MPYIVANEDAVGELQGGHDEKEDQEGVNQLGARRRLFDIMVVNVLDDLVPSGGAGAGVGCRLWRRGSDGSRGARRSGRRGITGVLLGRHDVEYRG